MKKLINKTSLKKILGLMLIASSIAFSVNAQKPAGLQNRSSVCYMNSVVQCIANAPEARKVLIANKANYILDPILGPFIDLIEQLKIKTTPQLSQELIDNQRQQFFDSSTSIQDAAEFLTQLLDKLPADAKNIFKTEVQTETECLDFLGGCTCKNKQNTSNTILGLGLEGTVNLNQAINNFFQGGVAQDLRCEICDQVGTKNKTEKIAQLPKTLILHLKRYQLIDSKLKKDNKAISFPLNNLDLANQDLANQDLQNHSIDQNTEPTKYDLIGIVCHTNDAELSLQAGHYYSYVKDSEDNSWYRCDDPNVQSVNLAEIEKIAQAGLVNTNDTPYILFYQLKNDDALFFDALDFLPAQKKQKREETEDVLLAQQLQQQIEQEKATLDFLKAEAVQAEQERLTQEQSDRDFAFAMQLQEEVAA